MNWWSNFKSAYGAGREHSRLEANLAVMMERCSDQMPEHIRAIGDEWRRELINSQRPDGFLENVLYSLGELVGCREQGEREVRAILQRYS